MSQIKMVDLQRQYQTIKVPIDQAIQSVLNSSEFIMGRAVRDFESALAGYLGVQFAIGCASGTDALQIALMALGIGPGDEVITSPFTFVATAETIALLGARPVYVDIHPHTYNLDAKLIAARVTPKAKAIIPVHLYGQPADMSPILECAKAHNLKVIEDTAQAIGARYDGTFAGTFGDIGCLSFFPSKNLGAYGDGGALLTNDPVLAQRCRMICVHGSKTKYHHELLGVNSRLDTLQAAILSVKLSYLKKWTEARRRIAELYTAAFRNLPVATPYSLPNVEHLYHQYSLRVTRRDELAAFLAKEGIASAIYYPIPLHLQLAFRQFAEAGTNFPVAEAVAKDIISLPIFPEMLDEEVERVASSIRRFLENQV